MAAAAQAAAGAPLSEEAKDAALLNLAHARVEARQIERRERENAHASVVLGKRLAAIQHYKQHDLEKCKSFDVWVEKHMPFRIKQARLYISVAHLPLDLVEGCRLSLTKLRLVAGAPAWARPALLAHSDRGTWESDLKRAIKAGVDHHQLHENVPEATAHLIEVLEGATALRKAKRVDDPEAVGDEAISALQKFLNSVKKLGQLDVRLAGRWVKQLVCLEAEAHAELSLLLRGARTDTPKSEGEMMDACAAAMRGSGRGSEREEDWPDGVAQAIWDLQAQNPEVQAQNPEVQAQNPVDPGPVAASPPPPAVTPPAESPAPTATAESPDPTATEATASDSAEGPTTAHQSTDAAPAAPQPVSSGWSEVYAAVRGALETEQQVLAKALIVHLREVKPEERAWATETLGCLIDSVDQIEGPSKLPPDAMRSLVQLLVREPIHDERKVQFAAAEAEKCRLRGW